MEKKKMNQLLKRIFTWVMVVGLLGSIAQGLLAWLVLGVEAVAAGSIIGFGAALTAMIGAVVISVFNANEGR